MIKNAPIKSGHAGKNTCEVNEKAHLYISHAKCIIRVFIAFYAVTPTRLFRYQLTHYVINERNVIINIRPNYVRTIGSYI